jgi:hypothetical protein
VTATGRSTIVPSAHDGMQLLAGNTPRRGPVGDPARLAQPVDALARPDVPKPDPHSNARKSNSPAAVPIGTQATSSGTRGSAAGCFTDRRLCLYTRGTRVREQTGPTFIQPTPARARLVGAAPEFRGPSWV